LIEENAMDLPHRSALASDPRAATQPDEPQAQAFAQFMGSATYLAHEAGRGIGLAQGWLTETAMGKYPLTTLGMAFGLGVFAGWFVKRR